jgi:hypothetical protein
MIRAHVTKDGRLVLPAGQSIEALLDKDVLVLVAPENAEPEDPRGGVQTDASLSRQGVYRQYAGERSGQSLRFVDGVLVFDAGPEAGSIDAETIERFIEQDREERLRFAQ